MSDVEFAIYFALIVWCSPAPFKMWRAYKEYRDDR